MYRGNTSPHSALAFIIMCLAVLPSALFAGDRFDVSYLWHRDVASVKEYRDQVAGVLGSGVAKRLKIVARNGLYGLIYHRRGDHAGAVNAAKSHTRLLRSRGLEAASAVLSDNWKLYDDNQSASKNSQLMAQKQSRPAVQKKSEPNPLVQPKSQPMIPRKPEQVAAASVARSKMTGTERVKEIRDLEVAVENYIKRLRQEGKIADDERTGWAVYDFTTGEKLVTINENEQFQAASLIKPFVAAAYFHLVEKGELKYGGKSRRYLERMIQQSNNGSTNWVMRQVGGPQAVERILKQHYPEIFRDVNIVEYIPANGRTYLNKASIHDYNRFLYAVWKEEIPRAGEIKRLMSLPGSDRIYTGTRDVPKGTEVYNKTGSTARLCGDMGILNVVGPDGKRYPYTIIGIIEKQQPARNYTSWIRARGDVIRSVSSMVYKGITQHHALAGVL